MTLKLNIMLYVVMKGMGRVMKKCIMFLTTAFLVMVADISASTGTAVMWQETKCPEELLK